MPNAITDAVRGALKQRLDQLDRRKEEKIRRTMELITELKQLPDYRPGFTDKDLYDEDGSPIF